jgi:thioredoxin reductase (NADPH)
MIEIDVLIVGGGPAGLSAGLYAGRAKMKTILINSGVVGGQIATTMDVENYPGSSNEITGPDLSLRMAEQCREFGCEIRQETFEKYEMIDKGFIVTTNKEEYRTKTLILATGANPRMLGCKGEGKFRGFGVSYCATCDANFFRNREIFVIGGGDTAIDEAIFLTRFASKVTVVHRRDELRAAKNLQEKAFSNEKIEFILSAEVEEIDGDGIVEKVLIKNKKTGEVTEYKTDGVFIFVGYLPATEVFGENLKKDSSGYIITDETMATNIPGIFAAGDLRQKPLRQVITAASDGAIAAVSAEKYISEIQ